MAEENAPEEEEEEEGGSPEEGGSTASKKSPPQQLIILAAAGFLLIIGILIAILLLMGDGKKQVVTPFSQLENEFVMTSQEEIIRLTEPVYVNTQAYIINLKGGRKYLSITLSLALEDQQAATYLKDQLPLVDDLIISLIQRLSPEELQTREGMELLKLNILREVNKLFPQTFIDLSATKDRSPVKKVLILRYFLN